MNQRLEWLDALKGFGMIWVIIGHTIPLSKEATLFVVSYMPLFFIATGYTIKEEPFATSLIKKAKRILLPYLKYGIVLGVTHLLLFSSREVILGAEDKEFPLYGLLYSRYCMYHYGSIPNNYFLPIETTSSLWFLTSLFTGIVFYLVLKLFPKKLQPFAIIAYILMTCATVNLPILLPWSIDMAPLVASFIWIGNEIKKNKLFSISSKPTNICISIISMTIYTSLYLFNGEENLSVGIYGNFGFYSVPLAFISGFAYFIAVATFFKVIPQRFNLPVAFVGKHTLTMMCIQMIIISVMKYYILVNLNPMIITFTAIMTTIAIAVFIDNIQFKRNSYIINK